MLCLPGAPRRLALRSTTSPEGSGSDLGTAAVNSPVWNIQTSKPIVDDHDDFDNPRLIAFFRQMYRKAEFREEEVGARAK